MNLSGVGRLLEERGFTDFPRRLSVLIDSSTDNLVLAGDIGSRTFEEFEHIAFENYNENQDLRVYAHSDYREEIEESDVLHEDRVSFFDSGYSSSTATDLLAESNQGDRSIFVADKEYRDDLRSWLKNGKMDIITVYE